MIEYKYVGQGTRLIQSTKVGWKSKQTPRTMVFGHGGPMSPSLVQTFGLTPEKASEYLVDSDGAPISGGKMLFAFYLGDGNTPPLDPEKPAAVKRLWGLDGHMYVFKVPQDTTYWSMGGMITLTAEVAFEYVVEPSDIVTYWAPSKDYVMKPGQVPNPRKNFQAINWQQYLLSRANAGVG
jgi:hypothetical protein